VRVGTQTIGLATRPHSGCSDLSGSAVARAISEAPTRDLDIRFHVADMRDLSNISESGFDAVLPETMHCLIFYRNPILSEPSWKCCQAKRLGILLATIRAMTSYSQPGLRCRRLPSTSRMEKAVLFTKLAMAGGHYALHVYMTLETESGGR